jgi:hypothetical protein
MTFRGRFTCGLLVCAVALSRSLFRSRYLYDIDSVNYALALDRFDPTVHQPHPPGYFLYVCLGRIARLAFHDANAALVVLSIAASCAAAAMIYVLADCWFGRTAAFFAGLIFLFSPLCWFHGTVALTYILEAFFSACVGYLCWRTYSGDSRFIVPSAIVLGIAAGCRQSSILFLGPLWLLSMRRAPRKRVWTGLAALAFTLAAWFIPMLRESGGAARYFASFLALWRLAPSRDTIFNSSIAMSLARFCTIVAITGLCFGSAALLFFWPRRQFITTTGEDKDKRVFTWVWIGPGLLFFTFVFLKYVNSGYLLILSPPVFAWLGARAGDWWYAPASVSRIPKTLLVGALAAANLAWFVYAPVYCSYRSVREAESELVSVRDGLNGLADSNDTLIVGFDSHFLGYRHAGYYLPRFLTVQFPELSYPDGKRVFALEGRDTRLLNTLPLERFKKFILFPLPAGAAEKAYLNDVRQRFPKGALVSIYGGGHEFLGGSTAALPILFPKVTPPPLLTQNPSLSPPKR